LPSVPHKVMHAESAPARWMRAYRRRIPQSKIEISLGCAGSFLAPRIAALFRAIRRSISSAMKLRLGRQLAPQPFRIRGSFGVARGEPPLPRATQLPQERGVKPQDK